MKKTRNYLNPFQRKNIFISFCTKNPFFVQEKVPQNIDAIVIGSGIGGMTTAVLMSKVGKKVLILEQHDQAGGCCHTFIDKGYEFDVGIHYIGEISKGELNRTLVDQITDGQLGKFVGNFYHQLSQLLFGVESRPEFRGVLEE